MSPVYNDKLPSYFTAIATGVCFDPSQIYRYPLGILHLSDIYITTSNTLLKAFKKTTHTQKMLLLSSVGSRYKSNCHALLHLNIPMFPYWIFPYISILNISTLLSWIFPRFNNFRWNTIFSTCYYHPVLVLHKTPTEVLVLWYPYQIQYLSSQFVYYHRGVVVVVRKILLGFLASQFSKQFIWNAKQREGSVSH